MGYNNCIQFQYSAGSYTHIKQKHKKQIIFKIIDLST
jgi:hypothetical protein